MKNKKVTYLLILAVAGLWALIFHRIYAATKDEDDRVVDIPIKKQQLFNQLNHQNDQWEFAMDYRNPFSVNVISMKEEVTNAVKANQASTMIPKPFVRWPEVDYLGWIGGDSKVKLALLNIGGKEMMLAEGQQSLGVKLKTIAIDSVKIEFERETRFIKLK